MPTIKPGQAGTGAAAAARFCTSCGAATGSGRFCGGCGSPLALRIDLDAPAAEPGRAEPLVPRQASRSDVDDQPTVLLPVQAPGPQTDAEQTPTDSIWALDDPAESSTERSTDRSRRRTVVLVSVFAVVVALIAGGVVGARYFGDGDLRTALRSSSAQFNGVVEGFAAATDAAAVSAAAATATEAAEAIGRARDRLGTVSDAKDVAVGNQLAAEQSLLEALAALQAVGAEPLATWGAAHAPVTEALEAETAARAALRKHDRDAADALADTGSMMSGVTSTVGATLVDDATAESSRLLEVMQSAKSTGDLRKLGGSAAPEQPAVAAAAAALPAGEGKDVLTSYGAALAALADLGKIDGESTASWAATRAELASTFGRVAAAAGSTGGTGVRVVLDDALATGDTVVNRAAAAMADWKAKTDAAIQARASDTEALGSYSSAFRAQAKTYEQLRKDLAAFTKRVEDPTVSVSYFEGYQFLAQAAQDRREVRDTMVGADVPDGLRDAHEDVVAAITRAVSAVQSAYDGLEQSQDCYVYCEYYRDTPGWQGFLSESDGITRSYTAAMQRWESAVVARKSAIADRALPAKPVV